MVLRLKTRESRSLPGLPNATFITNTSSHNKQNYDAGWSSPVARQAHNLKVTGSNPVPATKIKTQRTSIYHRQAHNLKGEGRPASPLNQSSELIEDPNGQILSPQPSSFSFDSDQNQNPASSGVFCVCRRLSVSGRRLQWQSQWCQIASMSVRRFCGKGPAVEAAAAAASCSAAVIPPNSVVTAVLLRMNL
jgi:hypothetical protein